MQPRLSPLGCTCQKQKEREKAFAIENNFANFGWIMLFSFVFVPFFFLGT